MPIEMLNARVTEMELMGYVKVAEGKGTISIEPNSKLGAAMRKARRDGYREVFYLDEGKRFVVMAKKKGGR